jgi:2-polyprenyl-3-methyl-5-hydroxy-6-metoxy-1,4-benzoquinol methylase
MKTVCVVQCTAGDLYADKDPDKYVIGIARKCRLFDRIVLAVPDLEASRIFEQLATSWQVDLHLGSVNDITERILAACGEAELIARVLLKRSYLDTELVSEMIEIARRERVDYVNLPFDFNYELAADIFTRDALEKVDRLLVGENEETSIKRFNPWYVMENCGLFRVFTHPGVDPYPKDKVQEIKANLKDLEENQYCVPADSPISPYAPVEKYLKRNSRVLDIATGQGNGAIRLRKTAEKITGVDINPQYIDQARQSAIQVYSAADTIEFVCDDAMDFSRPHGFDAITSMHTLEHLSDRPRFLELCRSNLNKNGRLFIEVPLLLPKPLGEPLYPFHQKEFLKPEIENLLEEAGFQIDCRLGRNRNFYTDYEKAREATQYHCSLRDHSSKGGLDS